MTVSSPPRLTVNGLAVSYGVPDARRHVLRDLAFHASAGELLCLVGPSGVGKTTLLRCLAGLQRPTQGGVAFEGSTVTGPPPGLSVVFQDYSRSLFPWLDVLDNVALPLRAQRVAKRDRRARAVAALEEVGLAHAAGQYPWQLSGGMQQRVAIARALVSDPAVLLMDEPFASVDAQTRFDLEDLTLKIRQDTGVAIVLVTHDIDEAVYLGDRVLVLGGTPACVRTILDIPFGPVRDQLRTRADRRFVELRTVVMREIQQGAATRAAPPAVPVAPAAPVASVETAGGEV